LSSIPSLERARGLLVRNGRDLVNLLLIPALVALLPWRVARPVMWRMSQWDWLFETRKERIAAAYREWVGELPPEGWVIRHRFHMLMDRVLPFKTALTSTRRI
jgi:hypothetical protein